MTTPTSTWAAVRQAVEECCAAIENINETPCGDCHCGYEDAKPPASWARVEAARKTLRVLLRVIDNGGVLERWKREHENTEGHHFALAGFEADIRSRGERLADAYAALDVYTQIALFAFVAELLDEESES